MSKREYLSRYLLIINFLKNKRANWPEILFHLENQSEIDGGNYVISQRTFQRDLLEINSLYQIEIKNEKSSGQYYMSEDGDVTNNVHLLDSFNLYNALSLTNNYSTYIQFEDRMSKGTEFIYKLLHSIKNKYSVNIHYHKFHSDKTEIVNVNPYLIKQFKGRFYLICLKNEVNEIRTYALDRIVSLDIKKKRFSLNKEFDAKEYFKNCFGIITPDWLEPEKIIFSFNKMQAQYIMTYPLHESQKIIEDRKDKVIFEIKVFITHDLIMELLSYGDEILIHSPKTLIKSLLNIHKKTIEKHQ